MKKLFITINAYGFWDIEHRHPIETIGYNIFLDHVTDMLFQFNTRIAKVVIAGGMKDSPRGGLEADSVKEEIERRLELNQISVPLVADSRSITSLTIARNFLNDWTSDYPDALGLLICDEARYETNLFLIDELQKEMNLSLAPAKEIVVPFPRIDISPNSNKEFQSFKIKAMKERGIEAIEQEEIQEREKRNG